MELGVKAEENAFQQQEAATQALARLTLGLDCSSKQASKVDLATQVCAMMHLLRATVKEIVKPVKHDATVWLIQQLIDELLDCQLQAEAFDVPGPVLQWKSRGAGVMERSFHDVCVCDCMVAIVSSSGRCGRRLKTGSKPNSP